MRMSKKTKAICCTAVLGLALVNVPAARADKASQKQALTLAAVLQNPQATAAQKQQACVGLMALGSKGAAAVPALDQMLKDPDPQMRGDAVAVLMKIGPNAHAAEPDLKTLAATDPNPQVRSLAADAVIQVSRQKGSGLLGSIFGSKSQSTSSSTGTSAAGTLNSALSTAQALPLGNKAQNTLNQIQQANSTLTGATPADATANASAPTLSTPTLSTPNVVTPTVAGATTSSLPGILPQTTDPSTAGPDMSAANPLATQTAVLPQPIQQGGQSQPLASAPTDPNQLIDTNTQPNPNIQLASYTQPATPQSVVAPAPTPQVGPVAGGNADYPSLGGGSTVQQLLIHQVSVQDNRVQTAQAFTLLVPDEWHGQASTAWTDANPASPAEPQFQMFNQQANESVGTQPAMFFLWSNNANVANSNSRSQSQAGAQMMAPPSNCQDALARIAWPARHGVQDAQVTSYRPLKDFAGVYATELPQLKGLKETLDGGVIRVHYSQNGMAYDEDLYGVLAVISNPTTGASNWVIDRMVDFKAPAGQLDALEKQMDFVYGSARPTVRWFGNYLKTQQYLVAKLNASDPNSIGQPQYGSDQMAVEPLNPQQAALMQRYQSGYDRSLLAIDRPIGGTEYFRNADGSYVPLPSGYGFAFTDGNGNYLVASTNTPMFPNINGNQAQWQPMTPIAFK
jgi:hypothetical protein